MHLKFKNNKRGFGMKKHIGLAAGLMLLIFFCQPTSFASESLSQSLFIYYKEYAATKNIVDLTKYLPKNYVRDGTIDYTSYLQKGIQENINVAMPDFPVMVNISGIGLASNQKVFFRKNSALVLKANDKQSYKILWIHNANNVSVFNPQIIGDKENHLGDQGQWGMGLSIRGSENVNIYNPMISKCWGDGIYINSYKDIECKKIKVLNGILDNNRRNGISVISGSDIEINGTLIKNTGPQNPQSGIDVEPNSNKNILENIKLYNIKTLNNGQHGIVISPGNIRGNINKKISIIIKNHIDDGSRIGLGLSCERLTKYGSSRIKGLPVEGNIEIIDSQWHNNSQQNIKDYGQSENKVKVVFRKSSSQ